MGFADSFLRSPVAGATDIRIVKRRVRKSKPAGTQVLDWVSNEVMGGSDVPDDRTPIHRITELQWSTPDGHTHAAGLAPDVELDDRDVADLLAYGRMYRIGVSVWVESAALDRAMRLDQSWFRNQPFAEPHPEVQVSVDGAGTTVVRTERPPPGRALRAWGSVFKTTGTETEVWELTIGPALISLHHVDSRGVVTENEFARDDVVALGFGVLRNTGAVVFAAAGGTELPSIRQEGYQGDASNRMRTAVHAANVALAAN